MIFRSFQALQFAGPKPILDAQINQIGRTTQSNDLESNRLGIHDPGEAQHNDQDLQSLCDGHSSHC